MIIHSINHLLTWIIGAPGAILLKLKKLLHNTRRDEKNIMTERQYNPKQKEFLEHRECVIREINDLMCKLIKTDVDYTRLRELEIVKKDLDWRMHCINARVDRDSQRM